MGPRRQKPRGKGLCRVQGAAIVRSLRSCRGEKEKEKKKGRDKEKI